MSRAVISSVFVLVTIACSGHANKPPDAAAVNDAMPADSAADAAAPDALATIACGTAKCDTATQICVIRTPVGPAQSFTCEPVPVGCEADRSCACVQATVCTGAYTTCSVTDPVTPDTVVCECMQCQ